MTNSLDWIFSIVIVFAAGTVLSIVSPEWDQQSAPMAVTHQAKDSQPSTGGVAGFLPSPMRSEIITDNALRTSVIPVSAQSARKVQADHTKISPVRDISLHQNTDDIPLQELRPRLAEGDSQMENLRMLNDKNLYDLPVMPREGTPVLAIDAPANLTEEPLREAVAEQRWTKITPPTLPQIRPFFPDQLTDAKTAMTEVGTSRSPQMLNNQGTMRVVDAKKQDHRAVSPQGISVFAEQRYIDKVKSLMADQKFYPRLARKKGLQGRGIIKLLIDQTGKLVDASILTSTSHPMLDEVIKSMAEAAQPFPSHDFDAPVEVLTSVQFSL